MEGVCRACRLEKAHKLPFPGHFRTTSAVGEIVHSDVVGPLEISFPDRFRYVSTFLDDHSRYVFVGLMVRRSALGDVFDGVCAKFRDIGGEHLKFNYSGAITKFHSDGAKEYVALQNDLGGDGMNKSFSPPYTPELNGIAERVNRTMVEAARSLLIQADLPRCLWPFALKHVIYVRNLVPHSAIGTTPFSVLTDEKPSLKHVRVFGCTAYVLRLPTGPKFESRALEGVYLETLEHGIYKVLVTDETGIPRIVESRHVTFDESKFLGAPSLVDYMDDEGASDSDFEGDSTSENDSLDSGESDDALSIDNVDVENDSENDLDDMPVLGEHDSDSTDESEDDGSVEEGGIESSN